MNVPSVLDVAVVGAGIVGAAVAREFARSGLKTSVVEHGVHGGATAAGMGHVVVMDDSPAQLRLTAFSRSLWRAERGQFPPAVEYEGRGTIWVAADDEEMAEVHAKQRAYASAGVASQVLDGASLAREEPHLRHGLAGGLLVPEDAVVYPPAAAEAYLQQALAAGAALIRAQAVRAARGEIHLADGGIVKAKVIVLATGGDASLLPSLGLRRRKGHLVITERHPGFARRQLVELGYLKSAHKLEGDSVAFNIQPRRTGHMLIGSSRQYGAESAEPDPGILRRMLRRAAEYMPEVGRLTALRVWTGFRSATDDKLPLIGPAQGFSDDPTLWLAMGFEGLGITNAPGAARLLADAVLQREPAIDPAPYLPGRFARLGELVHA